MISHVKIYAACLVILAVCITVPAKADISDPDRFVFDLVNQFRAAPYAHARSLGYDAAFLAQKGIGPDTGFAPYVLDHMLQQAARAANARAENPDAPPLSPVRRHMAETGSVLSFSHFMPVDAAGRIFVENLFKNELDTGNFQFILSDAFSLAGAGLDAGAVQGGMSAWYVTLVLGSVETTAEIQMLNLINQIRSEPALVQSYMDADFVALLQENPHIYHLPRLKFHPVFFDSLLYELAAADAAQPVPGDDAKQAALVDHWQVYQGTFLQSATVGTFWEDPAGARPVMDLFFALLRHEMAAWPFKAVVFSNRYTEAGMALSANITEQTGSGVLSVYAGSGTPRTPETAEPVRVYGLLFEDHDMDGLYAPGEEIIRHRVTVHDEFQNLAVQTITDNAGHFSLVLAPNRHWVVTAQSGEQTVSRAVHTDRNRFVKLAVSPPPPAPTEPPLL